MSRSLSMACPNLRHKAQRRAWHVSSTNPEHDLPASLLHYKWNKLQTDYGRVHDLLLPMTPNHYDFDANYGSARLVRQAVEDLTGDVAGAHDAVVAQALQLEGIPPGKIPTRLAALRSQNRPLGAAIEDLWSALMQDINDVRNEYVHEGFWRNSFGFGQGGGPMAMDFVAPLPNGKTVYIMRDVRLAAGRIHTLSQMIGTSPPLPPFANPCPKCYAP